MKYRVITAQRLADGGCVWMDGEGNWLTDINRAKYVSEAESEALLKLAAASVAKSVVVAPYAIEVSVDGGNVTPIRFREQVRVKGPTVGLPT
jgi:hypothetical protein